MTKGIFEDREHALEANYFRQQDARLIERLRKNAKLDDIAAALADKLQVDNPDLLLKAREAGITADTAPAFFLAPLVQVAWAEGSPGEAERRSVLRQAEERGIESSSAAYAQLEQWLANRPSNELFELSIEVLRSGFSVLPRAERVERIDRLVEACRKVAFAAGRGLAPLLGVGKTVSRAEADAVGTIEAELRKPVIPRT